jgi:hypothetical protein
MLRHRLIPDAEDRLDSDGGHGAPATDTVYLAEALTRRSGMKVLKDVWGFLEGRKRFWLLPIIVMLLGFGILIAFSSGSAIAPFVYTLF